jgi:predicted phosphodiesterase
VATSECCPLLQFPVASSLNMRYLILSDLHSNLEALTTCFELAKGKYDEAVCLGDLVGYGPDPNPVTSLMRQTATAVIRGNHDKACSGITDAAEFNPFAQAAVAWTRQALTPDHLDYLRQLPAGPLVMPGFEMVHGSEEDEDRYIMDPAEAIPALAQQTVQLVAFGHTHYQGGFLLNSAGTLKRISLPWAADGCILSLPLEHGTRYLVNPGSVGQPRDGDWRAAFAILDEASRVVDYYRASYDVAKTQEKMTSAGLPETLIRRLEFGR